MPVVLYEKRDKIAYVTLNRPEVLNAVNAEMVAELGRIWADFAADPATMVAIVSGAGERAFSAGTDLKEVRQRAERGEDIGALLAEWRQILAEPATRIWKPSIAAVHGYCLGAGCSIATFCDMRLASPDAQFGWPEVTVGLPTAQASQWLTRAIPMGMAMELLLTGDRIDAETALRVGLVNRLVPRQELMAAAEKIAKRICANGTVAVRATKEMAIRGLNMPVMEGLRFATLFQGSLRSNKEAIEGARAFAERKKAKH